MSNNQNILQGLGLVEELDEQAGETITGGAEVFTVRNKTAYYIPYSVDGTQTKFPNPGDSAIWTAYSGGIIKFDKDSRAGYEDYKTYNLADGKVYEFQNNNSTPGNPYDIELYSVA
ncbi:hypothetical protein [Nostoc sp. 'Peltigera malacea cyanobiont' DB3992]|uniref:hypothetical protein n=1 Tax=Nostoc sp. 'Peltigera malacea cyanobiont' DB3992 TaxID=1206980 RepID=UPI000C04C687|nr:hypothetical protein [Nostoc sp. 'Peltigera malacea cyanobiont' DB3992]PHM05957.1 hypothetical protein CK516_37120 [Nostoc sp. 'Peltigera malacea cyanobiont' DB3992]